MTDDDVERTLRGWPEVAACIPDFSLETCGTIERLEVQRDPSSGHAIALIDTRLGDFVVTLRLLQASGQLPSIDVGLAITELFIDDLRSDQREAICFVVYDEVRALHLYCRDAELSVRRVTSVSGT